MLIGSQHEGIGAAAEAVYGELLRRSETDTDAPAAGSGNRSVRQQKGH
jgi:hypothetical protein